MTSQSTNSSPQKVNSILRWTLAVFMGMLALGALGNKSFFSCFILVVLTLFLLPSLREFWINKFPFLQNRAIKIAIAIGLFFIGMGTVKTIDKTNKNTQTAKATEQIDINTPNTSPKEEIIEVETTPIIKYEIVYTLMQRYDNAPSYFILIDKIDISNEKFKDDIKNLVNKLVTEKGKKISLQFLDNKEALELYYKSHYGANKLGRILNKSELDLLRKHNIAAFSGELKTGIYLNSLYFFPSASNDTPIVGKYADVIEYTPIIRR